MHPRWLEARLLTALGDTPVVCLAGAARTGKTTLVQALQRELPAACPSFQDPATLEWATGDPAGFLAGLPDLAMLDDVQRAPGVLPLLTGAVARGGRFLLTSPRRLAVLEQSLAWKMETFTLWPLAQAERQGGFPGLIDASFQSDPARLRLEPLDRRELLRRVLAGGYPEAAELPASPRERWFHGYLEALVRGDLGDLTDLREVRQLLRLLAAPGADPGPAKRCLDLLEDLHVVAALDSRTGPAYRCFNDPGLQAHVLGMTAAALETRPVLAAPLLETFAVMELVKTAPWSRTRPLLRHSYAGCQLLVVLEDRHGDLVAVATDAAATVQPEAFQGLRALRERVGDRLKAGLLLHPGEAFRSAGPGLWAAPFQALWAV